MIEIYDYETSQNEMTNGLRILIPEFQNLCKDFEIDCNNECTYINYSQALKISISSVMVWGTKESLSYFLKKMKLIIPLIILKKKILKIKREYIYA